MGATQAALIMIWKPHATVAAIIERDNTFLMVEETVDGSRVFNQPAGHLEPEESLIDAVIRETREETAWQFKPVALIGVYLWENEFSAQATNDSFLRFAYYGTCHEFDDTLQLDDGIEATHWMSKEDLESHSSQLRSPLVLSCIDDYLAGHRYPLDVTRQIL